jgi:hypothetical protein
MAAAALALVLVGCGDDDDAADGAGAGDELEIGGIASPGGPDAWPLPPAARAAALAEAAGLSLEVREHLAHHVHAHLDVFIDGEHRTVPAGIGIVIDNPDVRTFDDNLGRSYGGIEECAEACISPLHTHDTSGVLHTESATEQDNTLGQLFTEWDVRLDGECVGDFCADETPILVFVDGEEVPLADAAGIALTDLKEIAIVIGDPPDRIPDEGDFSAA